VKAHTDNLRKRLGELAALTARTEADEHRILDRAEKRREIVQASIERARPGIESAPEEGQERYQSLITERGHLDLVIARARKTLGL
jgi:hypothetical protein